MHRRTALQSLASLSALAVAPTWAHHGWSGFDQDQPRFLAGVVKSARWQNPHAEAMLTVAPGLALPADLGSRTLPSQQQAVDGPALLNKAALPANAAGEWELEFAPLARMNAWGMVEPLKPGDRIEVIGYVASGKQRLMRVEYLFAHGKVAGLRSSPA